MFETTEGTTARSDDNSRVSLLVGDEACWPSLTTWKGMARWNPPYGEEQRQERAMDESRDDSAKVQGEGSPTGNGCSG